MCLWCYVHLAQAGGLNNYAGVLYMQGACIFMQGVVMECMVRLVRLGVGGNFFHTLGSLFSRLSSGFPVPPFIFVTRIFI